MFGSSWVWSVTLRDYPKLTAGQVEVTVYPLGDNYQRSGKDCPISCFSVNTDGYGSKGACIIFRPDGLSMAPGKRYWVELDIRGDVKEGYMVEFGKSVLSPEQAAPRKGK